MHDVQQIRRLLVWGIPLLLGLTAGSVLMLVHVIVPMLHAIAAKAPAVRIAPALQTVPFIAVFCLLGLVVLMMRAVPCSARLIKKFEFVTNWAVGASVIALFLIPVTSWIQHHYMPQRGYSACSELQDNPTIWFTDWVRNPAWCVKGKSLQWVNEQAVIPDRAVE